MGREIVYCFRCARRLTGSDFEKGLAIRAAYRVVCAACAEEMDPTPSVARPARIDEPAPPSPEMKPGNSGTLRHLMAAGSAASCLAIILLIAVLRSGRADSEVSPSKRTPPAAGQTAAPGPQEDLSERESSAMANLEEARRRSLASPDDLPGRIKRLTAVAFDWEGTSAGHEAHEEAQVLRGRLFANINRELEPVDRQVDAMFSEETFGKAFDLLSLTRARHPYLAWTIEVDRRMQRVESRGRELLKGLIDDARRARTSGEETDYLEIRKRVAAWGFPALLSEFERSMPVPKAAPPPPSAEVRAYLEEWERAWIHTSWGDFPGAERRLRDAAAALREPEAVKEAGHDVQDLVLMAALRRLVDGLLSSAKPGDLLDLVAARTSERPGLIGDPVYRAHQDGLEFKRRGQDRPYFVAFDELDWASRLGAARKKTRTKEEFQPRIAALLCLVSGNAAAAKDFAAGLKAPLLARQVAFGEGALPYSEGSASAFARHSRAASRLLYNADWEFQFLATHAAAVLKYRELLQDYAMTPAVKTNQELIRRRGDGAREYVFRSADLIARGTFERTSWRSRTQALEECWISREDVDADRTRNNYVEILFSPLPGIRYRCWVYAGGCCYESFTSYFQSTGYSTVLPETKESISLEPGGNYALPLRPAVFLRETHSAHARRDEPKKPTRWAWIEVPLAEYAEGGLKRVRLISDQKGFAVACAIVSSTREEPPAASETRALDDEKPEPTATDSPAPAAWLLLGPFQNRGFGSVEEPEEELGLTERVQTKAGMKSWTLELAQESPGAAPGVVLDFTQLFVPCEDVVVFAMIHVWAPEESDVALLFGSDDGAKVWLNDDLIHKIDRARGLKMDEDRVETRLRSGWNRFLVKVYQGKGGWGMGFRLIGRDGKALPALRYDPYGNMPELALAR